MNKMITLLLSGLLISMSNAYAQDSEKYNINQQNLSRQPYKQTPAKDQMKGEGFEGATLIKEDTQLEQKHKNLQLHRFDRRPYTQKSSD
jgi:hypothetical protein